MCKSKTIHINNPKASIKISIVNTVKESLLTNDTENNKDKTDNTNRNKLMHAQNGNKTTNILQINTSNADWTTKQHELATTININQANITVILEANTEINNNDKNIMRSTTFKNYNIEDKVIKFI